MGSDNSKKEAVRKRVNNIERILTQKCDEISQINNLDPRVNDRLSELKNTILDELKYIKKSTNTIT